MKILNIFFLNLLFFFFLLSYTFGQTYTNRVKGDLADPFVFEENGIYYAYGTDYPWAGFWVYTSKDLVNWSIGHECLAENKNGIVAGDAFWAPEVFRKENYYYMIYSRDYGLRIARSTSPEGPFEIYASGTLRTNEQNSGQWCIDGTYFKDDDGKEYIYYARIGRYGVWVANLSTDLLTMSNDTVCFNDVTQDEAWVLNSGSRTNEGPQMIKYNGKYYLFYSGNGWQDNYGVGYAVADKPRGPWKKYSGNPILYGTSQVKSPGHNSFAWSPDYTERFIVYHQIYTQGTTVKRGMCIDRIKFAYGVWSITGPTMTAQPLPSGASAGIYEMNTLPNTEENFTIYPNPSEGNGMGIRFGKNIPEDGIICLYDMQGREVFRKQLKASNSKFISFDRKFSPDLYFVIYFINSNTYAKKLIIK